MKTIIYLTLILIQAGLLTACVDISGLGAAAQPEAPMEELLFTGADFAAASGATTENAIITDEGIAPENTAFSGSFTSPPIQAPIPFNALVPQWEADLPEASELNLLMRTAQTEGEWDDWTEIHIHQDWAEPEEDEQVGQMVVVPGADETHAYVQYQIHLTRPNSLVMPMLRSLRLTFIDSTDGPTTEELVAQQQQLNQQNGVRPQAAADGFPKPFVVSREVWCTDPACDYSDGLRYQTVTHLIVHHTVSNNSSANWAAVVRAIWNFHTFSRDWGDVGYNFLVDMNGVVYEGHNGGDDVVGIHASGANRGTMAVALIGTFTAPDYGIPGITPPEPMLNAAVDMLSWKADQRGINVFDASDALPDIDWGLPHLMGHRDVYGTTECPGDQAHALIPWMRDRIAERIGLVDQHIYVDELSSEFTRSNANWFEGRNECGHNTHAYYTWSTTNTAESRNWGEWRPNLPSGGRYLIEAYVPYCSTGRGETRSAKYTITHADGVSEVVVSHAADAGLWIPLGEYNLRSGNSHVIRLSDLTADSGLGVWFDALRLLPLTAVPEVVNRLPVADSWTNQRTVNFRWQLNNPGSVARTTLEVASDPNFSNRVAARLWSGAVTEANNAFTQDYANLYWRVILATVGDELIFGPVGRFGLDSTPPASAVQDVAFLEAQGAYRVGWGGNDNLSGVGRYRIEWRAAGTANWSTLVADAIGTAAYFRPPNVTQTYEFRSQATDIARNVEAAHGAADLSTSQARRLTNSVRFPLIIGTPRR